MRMTYEYIQMTYEYIQMTYGLHAVRKKKKLTFLKLLDNPLSKYLICKRTPCMQ